MTANHQALLMVGGVRDPNAVSILAALRSWWSLDENAASSTYADSHGTNHLTFRVGATTPNTSTVSSTTAVKVRAGNWNRVDNCCAYIPRSNTSLDLANTNFSFGGWFRIGYDASVGGFLMGRLGNASSQLVAWLDVDGSGGGLRARATTAGTGASIVNTALITGWSSSEYAFVTLVFDRTNNQLGIRWRSASTALSESFVAFPGALYTGSTDANFTIADCLSGDSTFGAATNLNPLFYADECLFMDKAMTLNEFNWLFNSGAGRTYADLVAGVP